MGKHERTTRGLALLGQDVVISAVVRYQQRFRWTEFCRAFSFILYFYFFIGLQFSSDDFQIPHPRSFEDKQGIKRFMTEVVGEDLILLDKEQD